MTLTTPTFTSVPLISESPHEVSAEVAPGETHVIVKLEQTERFGRESKEPWSPFGLCLWLATGRIVYTRQKVWLHPIN